MKRIMSSTITSTSINNMSNMNNMATSTISMVTTSKPEIRTVKYNNNNSNTNINININNNGKGNNTEASTSIPISSSISISVIKKDNTKEPFDMDKVINAINKSASRVMYTFSEFEIKMVCNYVTRKIKETEKTEISINDIHNIVEAALEVVNPDVAKNYRDYRNYKQDFVKMLDKVYQESQRILYLGDKENSNIDSTLVATKRSLTYNELSKELYKKFFLSTAELQAIKDGYIYIHDMSARLNTMNCCLFDFGSVLEGGFEMGNVWYNEPQSLDVAFGVIGDIVMSASAQQYGGFTLPEVDKVLVKYAKKSFDKHFAEAKELGVSDEKAEEFADKKVQREFEQGFQSLEYKFNTVGSSRGDYPFITVTSGLSTDKYGIMCNKAMLKVRMNGQGKKGNKKPVLFPKIVFLYDEKLHGKDGILREVYDAGIACSQKAMYPDWLSLSGEGYVASMYKKYGKVVSPMGCRAFLSPWYEKGGISPADENDSPVFVGRFNIGAISLHLPMIFMKAKEEGKDFYEVLDYYMEMIRGLHKRTYAYLGEMRASINPLAFCEGGFYGGHLDYHDKIAPVLKSATASFGITALNELQRLYNDKSIYEDGNFALEVMKYINNKIAEYKAQDGWLYAIYGTPAESLAEKQVYQFRNKYGVIKNVSDRLYVSNSFHCHVTENITPIEKQDSEKRFWDLLNGGKIQYVRYPISYNKKAVETLVDRAMEMGFYEGVNLELSYCDDCGHEELDMDVCPKCGSRNLTKISRMNGYLSYSRVKGDTRLNKGKMEEIADRVSM